MDGLGPQGRYIMQAAEALATNRGECIRTSSSIVTTARRAGMRARGWACDVEVEQSSGETFSARVGDSDPDVPWWDHGWAGHVVAVVVADGRPLLVDATAAQYAKTGHGYVWPFVLAASVPRGWRTGRRCMEIHHDLVSIVYTAVPSPVDDPFVTEAWREGRTRPWDEVTPSLRRRWARL